MNVLSLYSAPPIERGLLSGRYWGELRIFAEVARSRSFNEAARRLGVSQPTIGRTVKRLQDVLGAKLVTSTRQGFTLTHRGEALAAALLVFDQSLYSIASDLKAQANEAEGLVSLSITDGMAAFFAAPAMPEFIARCPRIQMHFKSVVDLSDLRANQTDIMLTFMPNTDPDVVCRRLGSLHFVPIATQAYIACHGLPTRANVADHFLLQSHLYCTGGAVWREWQSLCAESRIAHYCDNSFAYGMMVKQGLGIGLLGTYAARERTAVAPDLGVHATLPIFAVALKERLKTRPAQLVFEWLCTVFDRTNPWFADRLDLTKLPDSLPALAMMLEG